MRRADLVEHLDTGDYTKEEYEKCLYQLERIGRILGGDQLTLDAFDNLPENPRTILDVGSGGGHFTAQLARKFPDAQVIGLDLAPEAVAYAQRHQAPNLEFRVGNCFDLNPSDFDVITSTLCCHHMSDDYLIQFLKWANRAKQALILNDLHRHPLAWLSFACISPILFPNRLIRHDGLISIRRGFKRSDWASLLEKAGIQEAQISWRWPFRWIIQTSS